MARAKITVKRIAPEELTDPTRVSLNFNFDTERIGPERTKQVWQGVGMIVAGVLDEAELREFQQKLLACQKQAKGRRKHVRRCRSLEYGSAGGVRCSLEQGHKGPHANNYGVSPTWPNKAKKRRAK